MQSADIACEQMPPADVVIPPTAIKPKTAHGNMMLFSQRAAFDAAPVG